MANLTIAVDDEVLRRARIRAAEQGTSVNAVLRDQLVHYADAGATSSRAIDEFLAFASQAAVPTAGKNWTREELWHERLDRRRG